MKGKTEIIFLCIVKINSFTSSSLIKKGKTSLPSPLPKYLKLSRNHLFSAVALQSLSRL